MAMRGDVVIIVLCFEIYESVKVGTATGMWNDTFEFVNLKR